MSHCRSWWRPYMQNLDLGFGYVTDLFVGWFCLAHFWWSKQDPPLSPPYAVGDLERKVHSGLQCGLFSPAHVIHLFISHSELILLLPFCIYCVPHLNGWATVSVHTSNFPTYSMREIQTWIGLSCHINGGPFLTWPNCANCVSVYK